MHPHALGEHRHLARHQIAGARPHQPQRQIRLAPRQVGHLLARHQLDHQAWVLGQQLRQERHQKFAVDSIGYRQPHHAFHGLVRCLGLAHKGGRRPFGRLGDGQHALSQSRGRQAARHAIKQASLQSFFKTGQAPRRRRLVQAQGLAGPSERAGAIGGQEQVQIVPVHRRRIQTCCHVASAPSLRHALVHGNHASAGVSMRVSMS